MSFMSRIADALFGKPEIEDVDDFYVPDTAEALEVKQRLERVREQLRELEGTSSRSIQDIDAAIELLRKRGDGA